MESSQLSLLAQAKKSSRLGEKPNYRKLIESGYQTRFTLQLKRLATNTLPTKLAQRMAKQSMRLWKILWMGWRQI